MRSGPFSGIDAGILFRVASRKEVETQKVPGLRNVRVDFRGGPLSAKREYLRMTASGLSSNLRAHSERVFFLAAVMAELLRAAESFSMLAVFSMFVHFSSSSNTLAWRSGRSENRRGTFRVPHLSAFRPLLDSGIKFLRRFLKIGHERIPNG